MRIVGVSLVVLLAACGDGGGGGLGGGGGGGPGGGAGGGSGAACSAANCTGCCFNGACQPGSTAAACGKNGAQCSACATNQVCRVDQSCGVDPESTWKVQPVSATIAPNNNGSSWDGDGSPPDVRVFMSCPSTVTFNGSTTEVQSYTPSWSSGGCTAKAKELLADGWGFQVFDIDVVSDDTITAALKVTITEQMFVGGGFSVQATGGLQTMSVQLVKQ